MNKTQPTMLLLLLASLLFSAPALAQDIRFSRQQLQQELDRRLPINQQHSLYSLSLSEPLLTLLEPQQRLSIRTRVAVNTALGIAGEGWITVDGQLRYQRSDYSSYIDAPPVTELHIEGLAPALQPQLQNLAQNLLAPAFTGQPVYTLKDSDMQEGMARMMLKSLHIEPQAVVAKLGF